MFERTRTTLLARLTAAAALLLIAVTYRVWLPPTPSTFPQVPLFGFAVPAGAAWDWAALAVMLLGLGGMLARPGWRSWPLIFAAGFAGAAVLNQVRVQVWAYQFALLALILASCGSNGGGPRRAVRLCRVLAVGILAHSSLSKLDRAFAEGNGPWLLGGLLSVFGVEPAAVDRDLLVAASLALPVWELAVAVLLAVPSTRRVGLLGACVLHATLVLTLGAGLGQSWGVLLWNGFFLAHVWVLFARTAPPLAATNGSTVFDDAPLAGRTPGQWAALIVTALAVLLPFGTRSGYWDVWPGWAVYANGVPGAWTFREATPAEMDRDDPDRSLYWRDQFLVDPTDGGLDELAVPIPQSPRVRVGVLLADVARVEAAGEIDAADTTSAKIFAAPDRFSRGPGEVISRRYAGIGLIAEDFLLNARPRALSLPPP